MAIMSDKKLWALYYKGEKYFDIINWWENLAQLSEKNKNIN